MKISEILDHIESDSEIEKSRLDSESLNIPKLHSKYVRMVAAERDLLRRLQQKMIMLHKEKWEYYSGKAPAEVYREKPFNIKVLKSELDRYIDSDDEVIKLAAYISEQQDKVSILEDWIKQINGRSFQIKNAIDYIRWTNGG